MRDRLCVDIDNCLASTDAVIREIIRDVTEGRVDFSYKDIREFDYHGPMCRDKTGQTIDKATWNVVHERFSEPAVISKIEPISGSIESIGALRERFDIHFATTRQPKARVATIQWLDQLGLGSSQPYWMHFVSHRRKHEILANIDAAIDDDLIQAELFSDIGVNSFLLAHPWNESPKSGITRVQTWNDIVHALM